MRAYVRNAVAARAKGTGAGSATPHAWPATNLRSIRAEKRSMVAKIALSPELCASARFGHPTLA